jgi:hypothetical protein
VSYLIKELTMSNDEVLREQLLSLLGGGRAHMSFDQAVGDFPMDAINAHAPNATYSPWDLLEHIRLAQRDILDFIRDPDYESPAWPKGFWPAEDEQADEAMWQQTINAIRADRKALQDLVSDPDTDMTAPIPHAADYNILREVLIAADHFGYHLGEFAMMRQVMDTWPS